MKLTEYIREKDVLDQWPMSKATLIRARKKGLPFVRLGAFVCYKPADLEAHFCQPRSWKADKAEGRGGSAMTRNEKADLRGIGSNEKHLTGRSKRFLLSDYKHFAHVVQCLSCGSDYMKFAIEGYFRRCEQHAEYVIREHPITAARTIEGGSDR